MNYRLTVAALAFAAFLFTQPSVSQVEGRVTLSRQGVEFVIPQGWAGNQTEDGYLLTSTSGSGLLAVLLHRYGSKEDLAQAAQEGFADDAGTELMLSGLVRDFGTNGVEAEFSGVVEYRPAEAYAVGLVSPHGGGLTVLGIAETGGLNSALKRDVQSLARSVVFYKPDAASDIAEWKQWLSGMKLTFMESYNSTGGGGYGGYSDKEVIELCPDGSFGYYSSSTTTVGVDGGGAYSGARGGGAGNWDIAAAMGELTLVLHFSDGTERRYALTADGNKLFMNGRRYYRTNDAECY